MTTIANLSKADALQLERRFQRSIHRSPSLEVAAQRYVESVYAELSDSIVLLRLFATVPFGQLPARNQAFARALGESTGTADAIRDDTLVLSLLGTIGVEPGWCDRLRSAHHVGIPLVSRAFVGEIPMVARLLKQLGVELDWIDRNDTAVVGKTFGLQSGVFYVADAATAVDSNNRKVITAQDFVARYGVETVFGVGGGYVGTPVFTTIIGFCRDSLDEARVERFRSHIDRFKAETDTIVKQGRIF
jgi:hypothetical protein